MAYSKKAKALRRCTATRKDGKPCRAYALWDDLRQLCVQHVGRGHKGAQRVWSETHHRYVQRHMLNTDAHAKYKPCTCIAYPFPHRPGGGICQYPDEPIFVRVMRQGKRSLSSRWWTLRDLDGVDLVVNPDLDVATRQKIVAFLKRRKEGKTD